MYESELVIPNETDKTISIWIEPWALSWGIPAGATCKLSADSEIDGEFELIEKNEELEIFGWCGSNLKIYINDSLEFNTEELRIPGLPPGLSTKEFVGMLFDNKPLEAKPKKWWQF